MTPLADEREIRMAVLQNVILTAASLENVRSVNAVAAAVGLSPRVHLCVDTGLGRHGFAAVRQDLLPGWGVSVTYTRFFWASLKRYPRRLPSAGLGVPSTMAR